MSTSFSANQYDDAFKSHNLQNWEVPMKHKKATWFNTHYQSGRPDAQEGFTQIIANDQGHLEPGVPRSNKNPWGDFVGTWDLPKKIPGNTATVATARRPDAQDKLTRHMDQSNVVIGGQQKNTTRQCKGHVKLDIPEESKHVIAHSFHDGPPPKSAASVKSHVHIEEKFLEHENDPHKVYPKTHYPTDEELAKLSPVTSPAPAAEC